MITLREAIEQGRVDQFIAEHPEVQGVGILTAIVVHADVAIAGMGNVLIAAHFVGADRRTGLDLL